MKIPSVLSLVAAAVAVFSLPVARAEMIPVPEVPAVMENGDGWYFDGGVSRFELPGQTGVVLEPGAGVAVKVDVPALNENQQKVGSDWSGVAGVDLFGTISGKPGLVEIFGYFDYPTHINKPGEPAAVWGKAAEAEWSVQVSSENVAGGDHPVALAMDGNPKTFWHSRWNPDEVEGPHWIQYSFGTAREVKGVTYTPRPGGGNGTPLEYRVETSIDGKTWTTAMEGEAEKGASEKVLRFAEPVMAKAVRLTVVKGVAGFATLAEFAVLDVELPDLEAAEPLGRAWTENSSERFGSEEAQSFNVVVKNTGSEAVVIGGVALDRIQKGGETIFGRSNGGTGPDILRSGLLGIGAQAEHGQKVLRVLNPINGGAAEAAGLLADDVIVSLGGKPLPVNDLTPGWEWFDHSHEAALGRTAEALLEDGKTEMEIGLMRGGDLVKISVVMDRAAAFGSMNPATDAEAAKLVGDMLKFVVEDQKPDGSWGGDPKRTVLAALSLMATERAENVERAKRAVDWLLKKYDKPEKHGNLGFWSAGYTLMLFSEWNLATGDERVLQPMDDILHWAFEGKHISIWGMPALGHGTNGLPYGEKSLVAPAIHLLLGESMAERCGVPSRLWELLWPYMEHSWSDPAKGGHGAMGYNASYKDLGEFWSRSGMFAMCLELRDAEPEMKAALTSIMNERHPWLRNSHAYGEPGGGLGLLALNLADEDAFEEVLTNYRWWFSTAWQPGYGLRFTQPHMGAPYMGGDDLLNIVYSLVLQAPKRNLHFTGRDPESRNWLKGVLSSEN